MEILTWVLEGPLLHKDSLGTVGNLKPGIMQCMSAGSGIRHSEYKGGRPSAAPAYEDRVFPPDGRRNGLQLPPSFVNFWHAAASRCSRPRC